MLKMQWTLCGASLVFLAACSVGDTTPPVWVDGGADADGDGWKGSSDCDDSNPAVNPGQLEVCMDGLDNDCDGWAGDCALDERIDLGQAGAKMIGDSSGDRAGWSVAAVGDLDGDGVGDIAVGSYEEDAAGPLSGAVYIFYGPVSGNINLAFADAKLVGEGPNNYAGWSVDGAGDINRDGFADLIIGAHGAEGAGTGSGVAYIVFGPVEGTHSLADADVRLEGESAYDSAGISVAGVGDINRDGYPDVVVGAYGNDRGTLDAGAIYLFRGPLLGRRSVSTADAIITGEGPEDWFGYRVGGGGDFNGDGYDDLIVGAPGVSTAGTDAGAAYVFRGPLAGTRPASLADAVLVGEAENDRAGSAIANAGDVDGDGRDDLLIGAWGNDTGGEDAGAVYLFTGELVGEIPLADAEARILGAAGDRVGLVIAGGGDVNRDGHTDVLLGVAGDDEAGVDAGAAWLFQGPISGDLPCDAGDTWFVGERAGDQAGASLGLAGDLDGDGFDDLLIGALGSDAGGEDSGVAYLVRGQGW